MPLDPYYESSKLKDTTDGIYTDVFDGLSYDEYDPQEAAEIPAGRRFRCAERQRPKSNRNPLKVKFSRLLPVITHGGAGYLC